MDSLEKYSQFLDTYKGRDKILRTLCYTSKLAAGLSSSSDVTVKLDNFSSQLSACRAALRLLDDVPMLLYVKEYGWGKQESDPYMRYTNLISNVVDLVFYPIDHIAWAIDHQVISSKNSKWSTASTIFWIISLYLNMTRAVRTLRVLTMHKTELRGDDIKARETMALILSQQKGATITALRSLADLIFAISYLPPGFMWSGKLQKWQVGALGTISSILGLYQSFL